MEKHRFKKGQEVHIDTIYHFVGLIPNECYDQDTEDANSGDIIVFIKDVTIKFEVIVK